MAGCGRTRQANTACTLSRSRYRLVALWPACGSVVRNSLARHFFAILEEMSKRSGLGEFELMILLSLIRLGDEAYGVPISKELLRATGREAALGSVYAALERLEKKGLVASTLGDPTPARGGRAKRYFRVTKAGMREAQTTRTALMNLWRGLPLAQGEHP
jgi:DNA-binding PadR family transcriptional regulator